jgi:hypothetical protein
VGFCQRFRHDDTLAGGDAIRLDDDRRPHLRRVVARGSSFREALIGGGRNAGLGAEILGVALRAFEARRFPARAEHLDAGLFEGVGQTRHQRCLRTDENQIDHVVAAKIDHRVMIERIQTDQIGKHADARIARGGIKLAEAGRFPQRPCQRMLAAARSDQENIDARLGHASRPSLKLVRGA